MPDFFQDLSTRALSRVIDANLIERALNLPRLLGGQVEGPNPLWFITGPRLPQSNGVVKANLAAEELDAQIEAALAPFEAQNLPIKWWVGPSSSPGDLGKRLQKQGFDHNRDMMGMAVDLQALAPVDRPQPAPTVERVRDKPSLDNWYDLLLQGFPITHDQSYLDALAATSLDPEADLRHYVARQNGQVVSISTLFLGAGVAGLYNLVTQPAVRGRGVGAWMTVETFRRAREIGYRVGTLQTTYPNALRMYHRLGFEVYCKIGIYHRSPRTG